VNPFRVAFVTGVTPDKWARTWRQRMPHVPLDLLPVEPAHQLDGVRSGAVDMAFVRMPVDRERLHLIPLYAEVPVVVVSREHPVAAYDEIAVTDLAEERHFQVPPMTVRQAVESVAAAAGVLMVPMSVARLHHRKDVVVVPVTGVEESRVGLAWLRDNDDPLTQTFIGIVRGRTERSSRQS
jgi:DNA-binding transcriptional LysR family regulator